MVTFVFTKQAEKEFLKLPVKIQQRILLKLKELKQHDDILSIVRHLKNFAPATHRLRMGAYRLILQQGRSEAEANQSGGRRPQQLKASKKSETVFWVLSIGHRKDIYR